VHNGKPCAVPFKTSVADRPPDHRPVFLLDPGLVVLAIGAAARELNPRVEAIIPHGLVHEHAVIVCVQSQQGESYSRNWVTP
jgi:hypothetical protein